MNYDFLLRIKYRKIIYIGITILIIVVLILISYKKDSYDTYLTYGIYNGNLLVNVPINNSDAVNNGKHLMIDNQEYVYEIKSVSEVLAENYVNYQIYEIAIKEQFKVNEVKKITFYYNQEKIYKKIINFIFGKEKKWI